MEEAREFGVVDIHVRRIVARDDPELRVIPDINFRYHDFSAVGDGVRPYFRMDDIFLDSYSNTSTFVGSAVFPVNAVVHNLESVIGVELRLLDETYRFLVHGGNSVAR